MELPRHTIKKGFYFVDLRDGKSKLRRLAKLYKVEQQ
jgi:hypothetical protein